MTRFLTGLGWGRAGGSAPPTAAILCRKRAFFPEITRTLAAAGIPFQVGGLGGLLDTPEVNDLWAALQVAHDPSRGDVLMRLLTGPGVGIGARDLMALSHWARRQVDRAREHTDREEAEQASIVEAIEHPPPPGWVSPAGHDLSDPARDRLGDLAGVLRAIRSLAQLPLPELVLATERLLGLDIEVLAHAAAGTRNPRTHLDEFVAVAADFQRFAGASMHVGGGSTLAAFLAWLDVAYEEEKGLATAEIEPDPRAVQVMTIHASKGLEWDAVVVAGLNEGDFPKTAPNRQGDRLSKGWLTHASLLPYELRGDVDHLPAFDHEQALTHGELAGVWADFLHAEGDRLVREDRRLAYVALTRARDHLLLTGSFWSGRKEANTPSLFLGEAVRAGADTGGPWPVASVHEGDPATSAGAEARWPGPGPSRDYWQRLLAGEAPAADPLIDAWRDEAELLLAERDAAAPPAATGAGHLSASAVVRLAQDAETFERNRRRPVPMEPSTHARRGTTFHAWVERYFGASTLLDWEVLPGADDETAGESDVEELITAFHASAWAARSPIRVEADLHTPIGGRIIRCRIDAVFRDEDGADHIVDWKTGAPARTAEEQEARDLQLALYRLAWARAHDLPLDRVRASYHYVAANRTVAGSDLGEDAILEVLARFGEPVQAGG
nr:3'-5' exonuclease [Pseudactinotalea sp. HY158]